MKLTHCPRCGGVLKGVSIGWICEKCKGFIDMQGNFHEHKETPFMPPKTNADRIRAMSDEELAERLIFWNDDWGRWETDAGNIYGDTKADKAEAIKEELEWLQQPAEGD